MFAYRLALMLGIWDVEDWLEVISDAQMSLWASYAEQEPFGPWAEDLRAGMQMAQHANYHRDTKKRKDPFNPSDFMLSRIPRKKQKPNLSVIRSQMEALLGKPDGEHQ